jgi:hypothetical protein
VNVVALAPSVHILVWCGRDTYRGPWPAIGPMAASIAIALKRFSRNARKAVGNIWKSRMHASGIARVLQNQRAPRSSPKRLQGSPRERVQQGDNCKINREQTEEEEGLAHQRAEERLIECLLHVFRGGSILFQLA